MVENPIGFKDDVPLAAKLDDTGFTTPVPALGNLVSPLEVIDVSTVNTPGTSTKDPLIVSVSPEYG